MNPVFPSLGRITKKTQEMVGDGVVKLLALKLEGDM